MECCCNLAIGFIRQTVIWLLNIEALHQHLESTRVITLKAASKHIHIALRRALGYYGSNTAVRFRFDSSPAHLPIHPCLSLPTPVSPTLSKKNLRQQNSHTYAPRTRTNFTHLTHICTIHTHTHTHIPQNFQRWFLCLLLGNNVHLRVIECYFYSKAESFTELLHNPQTN